MSKLINQLAGESEETEPPPPRAQQLELLGPLPISIKDPPSITASIPPRNKTLHHGRNKPQAEPMLTPPDEVDKLRAALMDAETRDRSAEEQAARIKFEAEAQLEQVRRDNEERLEALRLEIMSLQDSRNGERESRLAGEQRIRELEERVRSTPVESSVEVNETRETLDAAQAQLDDLRSQFRYVESSHEEQAHNAEQQVKELVAALETANRDLTAARQAASEREAALTQELQAARVENGRLVSEVEGLRNSEDIEAELLQARVRTEELENRLCAEAELRVRSERNAIEAQTRQADAMEARIREFELQARQLTAERDEALGLAQKAQTLREQEAIRFQERERLAAQRVSALRREPPVASRSSPVPSALPRLGPIFLMVIILVGAAGFFLGRWQSMGHLRSEAAGLSAPPPVSPAPGPEPVTQPPPKSVQWPSLKGNFIQIQQTSDRMTVVFGYAVFSRRTEIHPDALRDLQKLARQLAPLTRDFRIEIIGHTDADPVTAKAGDYSNNVDLGLKRAQTVRDVLIRQGGLPASALTAVSVGEVNPPYPNTTDELRKKNRTVTIALIPK